MPESLIIEWTEYLNWELETITTAVIGAINQFPGASNKSQNNISITDPKEKFNFLEALNKG